MLAHYRALLTFNIGGCILSLLSLVGKVCLQSKFYRVSFKLDGKKAIRRESFLQHH